MAASGEENQQVVPPVVGELEADPRVPVLEMQAGVRGDPSEEVLQVQVGEEEGKVVGRRLLVGGGGTERHRHLAATPSCKMRQFNVANKS